MGSDSPVLPEDLLGEAVRLIAEREPVHTIPVRGGSMVPTLRDGQRIAVEWSVERPERGDIVVFRQNHELVVHRYLAPGSRPDGRPGLRTRGDGRSELDPWVDPARVLGRVVAIEDAGGWWDLRSAGGTLYGLAVAFHDLAWALVAVAARRIPGGGASLVERVAAWDRRLLDTVHRRLFAVAHRRLRMDEGPRPMR